MEANEKQLAELKELVARIAHYQNGTSDKEWCQTYKNYIGTPRTWRQRLVNGDYEQMDIDKQVRRLRELISLIEGGSLPPTVYEDLPFYKGFQTG